MIRVRVLNLRREDMVVLEYERRARREEWRRDGGCGGGGDGEDGIDSRSVKKGDSEHSERGVPRGDEAELL